MTYTVVNDALPTGVTGQTGGNSDFSHTRLNAGGEVINSFHTDSGFVTYEWSSAGILTALNDSAYTTIYSTDINASGEVVGDGAIAGGSVMGALLWGPGGGLPEVLQDAGGQGDSLVVALNDAGFSVGSSGVANNGSEAVKWNVAGSAQVLASLGTSNLGYQGDSPCDINNLGEAGGSSNNMAVEWSSNGSILWHGINNSQVRAINATGAAIGSIGVPADSDGGEAVYWSPTGKETVLDNLGLANEVVALNNSGHSVGYTYIATGAEATEWTKAGAATILARLPNEAVNGWSAANDINNRGASVGFADMTNGTEVATYWSPNGVVKNLNKVLGPAWTNTDAMTINDAGDIAGIGTHNSIQSAWELLWVPKAGSTDNGSYVNAASQSVLAASAVHTPVTGSAAHGFASAGHGPGSI